MNRERMLEDERNHLLSLKSTQRGHPIKNKDELQLLKEFYENAWHGNQVVTVNMLCFELKRLLSPADEDISALRFRRYRW